MAFSKPNNRQKRIDLAHVGEEGQIAVLVAEGFAASDLTQVASAAERAGYKTCILSPNKSLVGGRSETREEMNFVVDGHPGDKGPEAFAGLLVPGGASSIEKLKGEQDARLLLGDFVRSGKPVCVMGEAVGFLSEVADKDGVEGDAALALNGEVFAAEGETAREDATATFIKTLDMSKEAA
ncbi:MAG: DJ-1/PfpI family protein [Oceanicaulis sp.]